MYICGQTNVLERIDSLIERDKFPRFSIIIAPEGHGKKVISDYIARKINAHFIPCKCDVESVRNAIAMSYETTEKSLYMFFDCDDMSVIAKNTLLKVTEEPPNNAYFIMTIRDVSNALNTILSRGTSFYLEPYKMNDLIDYSKYMNYSFDGNTLNIIQQICTCPKDIQVATNSDIEKVYKMADKFIQLIGQWNIANELKITSSLSTKKDDGKINPIFFLRCVMMCCYNYMKDSCSKDDAKVFHSIILQTTKCLRDLSFSSCNKQMALDNYIINTHLATNGGVL
jgi:replication-associated recombination protein RarA